MEKPLYDTLLGNWSVNREIEDRIGEIRAQSGKPTGFFTGTALFRGARPNLTYREEGELTFGGTSMQAERQYIWQCGVARATVLHQDGSPFHDFTLTDGAATAEHLCGEDMYRGAYSFHSPDEWTVSWVVSGPRKDYTSVTTYKRAVTGLQ